MGIGTIIENEKLPPVIFDHVAFVVDELSDGIRFFEARGLEIGEVNSFAGTMTEEVYIGVEEQGGRILLISPDSAKSPYSRALDKRGAGLHHVAVTVGDLDAYLEGIADSGWLLHPRSLHEIDACRTAWLARPGVGTLVEVHESRERDDPSGYVVEAVAVSKTAEAPAIIESLECPRLRDAVDGMAGIVIDGNAVSVEAFCGR